jgi:chorismate dehydratase
MKRLRISAISYLNTAPLIWDFERGPSGKDFDIFYTVPSRCAENLRRGSADIGIIPAAAYTMIPDLAIIPGVAIASRRPVRSILLISRHRLDPDAMTKIETVALDNSSLTSVALTKVLFSKYWGGARLYSAADPDIEAMLGTNDAALLIGDPALKVDRSRFHSLDLAEEWIRFTGLPFVFAFWAVRQAALREASRDLDLARIFQNSRDHGLEAANLRNIVTTWAARLDLSEEVLAEYLNQSIYYHLDSECLAGLSLFYRYAEECGALPVAPQLQFVNALQSAAI